MDTLYNKFHDRGAWQAKVHGVEKHRTQLSTQQKYSQYFIITTNGVQPLKPANHYIVHL